ncbi:VOC family protein [Micromonospora sp. C28SCA-DRY-2]|uniref:VOC family protein n=1 Tax=Micromonospora sp. C28SCA-DRY-2 TaxID=3059522 RepID=UPI002675BE19|nr:VOC family protein [Micromonospora sp. C28SCA-DRY-2]MDO3703771.1 VOC family protein [Micromonospora sp. C28SCA-DRY-2]
MTMNALTRSQIYVLDQNEALDFYVGKLGMEVHTDADLGFMRWLTVNVPGDRQREILLETPGPPRLDPKTAEQVRELLTKGAMGGSLFLTTDDAHKTYADLVAKGVDITDEPTDRPYGIDFGIRDPFGNHIRIGQMHGQG